MTLHFSNYALMTFLALLSMLIILFSTLSVVGGFDLWKQLNLQNSIDWRRRWLVDLNAEKTQLVSFYRSNNTGAIAVEIDEGFCCFFFVFCFFCFFEWKSCFKMQSWNSLLNCIESFKLSLLLKLTPRKLESGFDIWSLFLLTLLCIFINLP